MFCLDISEFALRLAFLVLPGVLTQRIYRKLQGTVPKKDWEDFIDIFVYSIINYLIYALVISIITNSNLISSEYTLVSTFNSFLDKDTAINYSEIFGSCIVAVLLAFFLSFMYKKKFVNKLGQLIRVTNRYGDEDLWNLFHNTQNIEWFVVRDHKINLYYYCWIYAFSESNERRELILRNASVYTADGDFCYEAPVIYLCRDYYDITIEVYDIKQ